jgi:hypothetical protein
MAVAALAMTAACALADVARVHVEADPGLSPTQARQQALQRALPEAVMQEAMRLLPKSLPQARQDALRAFLTPQAVRFVQSYQESQPAPDSPPQGNAANEAGQAEASPAPQTSGKSAAAAKAEQSLAHEMDVTVNRQALRDELTRLGFLAGARHPGVFALRLGHGVKEKDAAALSQENALLGLARVAAAPQGGVEILLERLPQGYYKAVLRQGDLVLAEDASALPALWLNLWAKYFADSRMQPGPGRRVLLIDGFAGVDAVQEFLAVLSTWDNALREPQLDGMDIGVAGVGARIACRVIDESALRARLDAALAERRLSLRPSVETAAP